MKELKSVTKDPICGITVDEATALRAERDGKMFSLCSDYCWQKLLSTPAGAKTKDKFGGCRGNKNGVSGNILRKTIGRIAWL
jgi:YHS domain-containing protein